MRALPYAQLGALSMKTRIVLGRTLLHAALFSLVLFSGAGRSQAAPPQAASDPNAPHLQKNGNVTQMILDGKPFLILGGEVHNSSSSNAEYMRPIWPKLAQAHLNTVLTPVTWQQIEPEEGHFDFSVLDTLIHDARAANLRLVLLWMGSWKNGNSTYTPSWVQGDSKRFALVQNKDGRSLQILSTFCEANRDADARAFAALMRHVRDLDSAQHTVIMIQLENEVGVLGDSRDRSPAANDAFAMPVPKTFMEYLAKHKDGLLPEFRAIWEATGFKTSGTWEDVFGRGPADEIFMAWNYARYVDRVAEAGKAAYSIPMYINTWLVQPEDKGPGDYPSGGAVAQMHDVWQAGAPHVDILSPDIHLPDTPGILASYSRNGNPVFIPESSAGVSGSANAFYAFGQFGAIGYSPFGIEDQADPESPLSKAYAVLSEMAPLILQHQAAGTIAGAWLTKGRPSQDVVLGDYTLHFALRRGFRSAVLPDSGYALVLATGPNEYTVSGSDIQVTFSPNTPGPPVVGLGKVEEGTFQEGHWVPGRWLNGDETQLRYDLSPAAAENQSGTGMRFAGNGPTIQRVQLYRYP
jgi:hypothetical protein